MHVTGGHNKEKFLPNESGQCLLTHSLCVGNAHKQCVVVLCASALNSLVFVGVVVVLFLRYLSY